MPGYSGRIRDLNKVLPIIELYPAIQAEGSRAGYPTVIIRTTGCTHRCYFGEVGGWCDSWYSSVHPEKGRFSLNDVFNLYAASPHIKEMLITGGAPTLHPVLLNELIHFAHESGIFITLETEGSHYLSSDQPVDLVSISPKFSRSIPTLGMKTPLGATVDERMIKQHNQLRLNHAAIARMITDHTDYHIKPVLDETLADLDELEAFLEKLNIPDDKVWVMPAGGNRQALLRSYPVVMNYARDRGWRFSPRPHIMAFDARRGV